MLPKPGFYLESHCTDNGRLGDVPSWCQRDPPAPGRPHPQRLPTLLCQEEQLLTGSRLPGLGRGPFAPMLEF